MLTTCLLLPVLMIVMTIVVSKHTKDWFFGTMAGPVVGILLWLAAIGINNLFFLETEYRHTATMNIVSLRDTAGIESRFILGSGSIGSKDFFIGMVKNGDGSYRRYRCPADESRIYMGNHAPRIEVYSQYVSSDILGSKGTLLERWSKDYRIYIPNGSIVEEFRIQ